MTPEVIESRIEGLLEQIKREHAEHLVKVADREATQFRWFAGAVIGVLVSGLGVLAAILLRIFVELP